jgi:hypothetical protein
MCHEISGFDGVEIGGGKGLNMIKKFVAETFFNPPGCADETASPKIPKHTDQNGNPHDVKCIG